MILGLRKNFSTVDLIVSEFIILNPVESNNFFCSSNG